MSTDLKVVTLHESTLRDVPAKLRQLASQIEAGQYGHVSSAATVILGDTMEVFSWGDDSSAPSAALLFQAGVQRIAKTIETAGQ